MEKEKIKIAVWNIYGPTYVKDSSPKTAQKIECLEREVDPDIAFYLEAPDGTTKPLPDKFGCRKLPFYWVGADAENKNPRGILVVDYTNTHKSLTSEDAKTLKVTVIKEVAHGTGIGIQLAWECGKELKPFLRIIGVWTTPPRGKNRQNNYFESLTKILQECKDVFLNAEIPCIVVGDTNLNLSSGAPSEAELNEEPAECKENREKRFKSLNDDFGLRLFPDAFLQEKPDFDQFRQNTLQKTVTITHPDQTKQKQILWYRCDFMLVSEGVKIESANLGKWKYEENGKEICKSDHRPIIFEVSVPKC